MTLLIYYENIINKPDIFLMTKENCVCVCVWSTDSGKLCDLTSFILTSF